MRQKLLARNKFLQYVFYASGEIILVIAGILIALAINNQSELNKKDEKISSILMQVRQELALDIAKTSSLIEFYIRKDSLISLVLGGQLTVEDYDNPANSALFQVTTTVSEFITQTNGYDHLMRNIDNMPPRFEPLIEDLSGIYVDDRRLVERFNESISEVTDNVLKEWSSKFTWYSKIITGVKEEAMMDYFANDPFYKNHVSNYYIMAMQNHLPAIKQYRVDAIDSYKAIGLLLGLEHDVNDGAENFIIPQEALEKLAGTYGVGNGFTVVVKVEDGQLIGQAQGQSEFLLDPLSPTRFFSVNAPFTIQFELTEAGEATSLINYQNGRAIVMTKQ
ncbi:MAG: DUF3471 domain-containing protein [Roseivirga sp.]|nr:DUF3471 domain-containing protein [Roseivirga sp.]